MSLLAGTPGSCSVLWAPLSSRHLHLPTSPPPARELIPYSKRKKNKYFNYLFCNWLQSLRSRHSAQHTQKSKALFCSKIFCLLQQHCYCSSRSHSSCLSLYLCLSSLPLLFFPSVCGAEEAEIKHRLLTLPAGSGLPKPIDFVQSLPFPAHF